MADKNKSVSLNSGQSMPLLGMGTWRTDNRDELINCIRFGILNAGYRHIDTASVYGNEDVVGEALTQCIAEGVN